MTWKLLIATLLTLINTNYSIYANTFAVVEVTEDYVLCVDFNGDEWAFDNEEDDWLEGDLVSCVMCDMGTESIYDDEILSVKYTGWVYDAWGYDEESNEVIVYYDWD